MSLSRLVTACLTLCLCALGAARAADEDQSAGGTLYSTPEIVVTASRIEWPIDKTGSFITVISKNDIQKRHAETVGDLLRTVVGLNVVQSGSTGKAVSLFIRGAASNHCLVMLDGVPLNDPTTGAFDFSELAASAIERIEIVRGPNGILYGSNAIGGVVNIITSQKDEAAKRCVSVAAGSYGSIEGTTELSGGDKRLRYSGSLSGITTRGQSENDFHRNVSFSSVVSSRVSPTANVSLNLRYGATSNGLRGPRFDPDPNAEQSGGHLLVSATFRQFVSEHWNYSLRTSFLERDITFDDPLDYLDTGLFIGDSHQEIASRVENVAWQNNLRLSEALWMIPGVEWKEERTTNDGRFPFGSTNFDDRIRNTSLFLNGIADFKRLPTVSAGVRLDDHSEFGTVATYKCSLSYPIPRTGTSVKASVGTGFRAPSLNELYYPGYGNPDLSPERTIGWDCGLRHEIGRASASVEAAYFHNSYRNLISFNPATWLADNIGEALSDGVECSASVRPAAFLAVEGFYAFTRTEDRATGKALLRRPRHSGGVTLSYRGEPVEATVSASFVGARLDNDFGGPRGEYYNTAHARLDAVVTYSLGPSRQLFCRVGNLLDERYDEVAGYPAPGATVMAGTRLEF
jgi:vitamin B12 transporter